MERTIKIWLSIIFPGLLGFVASCLVILPQLQMRGLSAPWDVVLGVGMAALFAILFSRMLSRHLDTDVLDEEEAAQALKASTADDSPFAVGAR